MKKKERVFSLILIIGLSLFTILNLSPFAWIFANSFRPEGESFASSILPQNPTLSSYAKVITGSDAQTANAMKTMWNSFVVAIFATILCTFLSLMAAYGFSRFRFPGRSFLMSALINLRTFPSIILAIALFAMAGKVGLYNTLTVLVLCNTMLNLPFATWNNMSIIDSVPVELDESGMVDGLGRVAALFRIVLPVAAPGLAGTTAYIFILSWNEYLFATNFISSMEKQLVTTRIASAVTQTNTDYGALMATSMLATIPLILLFLLIQKYIVSGLTMGSVKG